jgi:Na+-transporting NADH:ubiquinone oxidoreductase subunit NqrB
MLTATGGVWLTRSPHHFPRRLFLEGEYAHLQSTSTQFHISTATILYNTVNKHDTECTFYVTVMLFNGVHKTTAQQEFSLLGTPSCCA